MKIKKALIWFVAAFSCYGCLGVNPDKSVDSTSKNKHDNKKFYYVNSNRFTKKSTPNDDAFAETPNKIFDLKLINASHNRDRNINDYEASVKSGKMYCYKYTRASKTVSMSFKSKNMQRLVVYLYNVKDDNDNVKQFLYIPGKDTQYQMPDLPLRETDLLVSATHLKVSDILNNHNPFILTGENFPSVPSQIRQGNVEKSKINRFKKTLHTNCCRERDIFDLHLTYCNYPSETTVTITQPKLIVQKEISLPDVHESSLITNFKNWRDNGLQFLTHINKNKINIHDIVEEPIRDEFPTNFDIFNTIYEEEIIDNEPDKTFSDADLLEDLMSIDDDFTETIPLAEYNLSFGNIEHHTIEQHAIWNKHSTEIFEKWFTDKVHKDSSLLTHTQVNENRFRKIIHDALIDSGISITSLGKLQDTKGNLYDFDNLEIIPIFIGINRLSPFENFDYDSSLSRKYIKAVVIMSKKPKAILCVTPIIAKPVKIASESHSKPYFKIINRAGLFSSSIEDEDLYDLNDISDEVNKKFVYEAPIDEKSDVEFVEELLFSSDKDKPANDNTYPDSVEDIDAVLPKILGGHSALGSGSQISNKGRSGWIP